MTLPKEASGHAAAGCDPGKRFIKEDLAEKSLKGSWRQECCWGRVKEVMLCYDGTQLVLLVGPFTSQHCCSLHSNLHQHAQLLQEPPPGAPSAHPLRSPPSPFPACSPGHPWPGISEPRREGCKRWEDEHHLPVSSLSVFSSGTRSEGDKEQAAVTNAPFAPHSRSERGGTDL